MYDSLEQARLRLDGSVILWKGHPYYVRGISGRAPKNLVATFDKLPIGSEPTVNVNLNDPDIEVKNIRFGYWNTSAGACYITRIPNRNTHQGILLENLYFRMTGEPRGPLSRNQIRATSNPLNNPTFADMFCRKYPTFNEVLEKLQVEEGPRSIAFHPHFALEKSKLGFFTLHYKGKAVAWSDDKQFRIPPTFQFLRECCREAGIDTINQR